MIGDGFLGQGVQLARRRDALDGLVEQPLLEVIDPVAEARDLLGRQPLDGSLDGFEGCHLSNLA